MIGQAHLAQRRRVADDQARVQRLGGQGAFGEALNQVESYTGREIDEDARCNEG